MLQIAWKAQTRLCERYQALLRHRKKTVVVVTAIARELVGFLWAIARELAAPGTAAAEALQRKAPEALKEKETEALAKATPVPEPRQSKAGRPYALDARKQYEPAKPAVGKLDLQTKAGKALKKETKETAAR